MPTVDEQLRILTAGTVDCISEPETPHAPHRRTLVTVETVERAPEARWSVSPVPTVDEQLRILTAGTVD